jgi:hypothetical protein
MSAGEPLPQLPAQFLPSWLYSDPAVADQERNAYAGRLWHPLAVSDALREGEVLAVNLLEQPLLLTRAGGVARAFRNRCPHRGVPFALPTTAGPTTSRAACGPLPVRVSFWSRSTETTGHWTAWPARSLRA